MGVFSAGTRLGPYDILGLVGEGGMGDVYKARDSRLDRIVALKVSKEAFTPRFETEARATAALEHPHICRLYDISHDDGVSFLVMEYVEGTPLKGLLPFDRALLYAGQIASALDAAHRKQIIHRDLKPSNILVTSKGGVKLLDFGLAKFGREGTALDDATLTRGLTAAGTIIGTLHYMSPEQLQGIEVDARSDIFAFGLVFYEMLTGKRAFDGASAASIIAAILERPAPSVSQVAPASLDRLLQRCLAKDPDERWQSARDIKAALDLIVEKPIVAQVDAPSRAGRRTLWPWLAAGVMGALLASLALLHFRETTPQSDAVMLQIPAPPDARIVSAPHLSPNGRMVAFVAARADGRRLIWVRRLDSLETRSVPGTEESAENIFWSPDSSRIAFSVNRQLKTIEVSGSGLRTVSDLPGNLGGGTWNSDGVMIVALFTQGIFRIPAAGGTPIQLATPSADEAAYVLPSFLPDGRHFVYTAIRRDRTNVVRVVTVDGMTRTQFATDTGTRILYASVPSRTGPGYMLLTRGDTLVAQPVDAETLAPSGESVLIGEGLGGPDIGVGDYFSASATGALAYLAGGLVRPTRLTWFDRAGKPAGTVGPEAVYNDLSLSPDEARVAVTRTEDANEDIWVVDLARNVPSRFTTDPAQDWHPVWSPDGQKLAFSSTRLIGGRTNSLFWKDTTNVGNEDVLWKADTNERLDDWSPDGRFLLVNRTAGRDDLWIVPVSGDRSGEDRQATPYLASPFVETRGQFLPISDPNGRNWIAYTSNESGRYEVYVESFPRGAPKVQVSTDGGMQPRWRRDGKELFYVSLDRKLMAVGVTPGATLTFGPPEELFRTRMSLGGTLVFRMLRYDVTRDGKKFLMNADPEGADDTTPPITVLLNWAAMLGK